MRRIVFAPFFFVACTLSALAQVVPSATAHHVIVTAGGTGSVFQPDYQGDWSNQNPSYPVAHSSSFPLVGAGAYVDVRFTRWVQIEAEGRWQRFNQYDGIYEDNYLIGPRVPLRRFGKADVYVKTLAGFARMRFDNFGDHGQFTDIAFGGGMDIQVTRRLSIRAIDAEYQYWPTWGNSTLAPYGASVGVGYRVF